MAALRERIARDPGGALAWLAGILAVLVYGSVLRYGVVNYDDTWLVRDNFILQRGSFSTLSTIFFDTSAPTRFLLGAEYLPVRDMSVLLDFAIWGTWYAGHHLTNLVLYVLAIWIWFRLLVRFGVDRTLVGLAILLWAVHPTHAESVAWLSERKGLLGLVWAGVAGLMYLRFRRGGSAAWLAVAVVATVLAVWSKSLAAFTIATFGVLEVFYPADRVSWRRSLGGLAAMAVAGGLALVPVVQTAQHLQVVAEQGGAPAGKLAMVVGGHGFYVEQGVAAFRNAIAYPIATQGPTIAQLVLGALSLAAFLALAVVPRRGRWNPPPSLRAGAAIWLLCWFPASRLVLPLKAVLFADRYALVWTLGLALIAATLLLRMKASRARSALVGAVVLAFTVRAFDAQSNWRSSVTLWQRAVVSDPGDDVAWSSYAEALESAGRDDLAFDAVRIGLTHTRAPRIMLRRALMVLAHGQRPHAIVAMREAAMAGEPRAMSNLSYLLLQDGHVDQALEWGRRAVENAPMYAKAHQNLGAAALAAKRYDEALLAFRHAYELWPVSCSNRNNLAIALVQVGRRDEARAHLEACMFDPAVGSQVRALYVQISR